MNLWYIFSSFSQNVPLLARTDSILYTVSQIERAGSIDPFCIFRWLNSERREIGNCNQSFQSEVVIMTTYSADGENLIQHIAINV